MNNDELEDDQPSPKSIVTAFLIGGIGIGFGLLFKFDRNLFLIGLFTIPIIALLFLLKNRPKRIKVLFILIALFIFFNFIFFPLIYTNLLKRDSHSIIINNDILLNEKSVAATELEENYSPEGLKSLLNIFSIVGDLNNPKLDTSISYLTRGNILLIDTFMIAKGDTVYEYGGGTSPPYYRIKNSLLIYNNNGSMLFRLHGNKLTDFKEADISIRNFIIKLKYYYAERLNSYKYLKNEVSAGKRIWSYRRLLPYVINIFYTDNFKPISRQANLVYNIHYWISWVLFAPIIFMIIGTLKVFKPTES